MQANSNDSSQTNILSLCPYSLMINQISKDTYIHLNSHVDMNKNKKQKDMLTGAQLLSVTQPRESVTLSYLASMFKIL